MITRSFETRKSSRIACDRSCFGICSSMSIETTPRNEASRNGSCVTEARTGRIGDRNLMSSDSEKTKSAETTGRWRKNANPTLPLPTSRSVSDSLLGHRASGSIAWYRSHGSRSKLRFQARYPLSNDLRCP